MQGVSLRPFRRVLGLGHGEIQGSRERPPADGDDKPLRHLYLIDGSGYLFRAYHALPPMNRPDGTPINAVFGFCRMLVADLLDNPEVDHIAMILDAGSVTFRNEIYDKYKANRPEPPEDLIPQFPLIREAATRVQRHGVRARRLRGRRPDRDLRPPGASRPAAPAPSCRPTRT